MQVLIKGNKKSSCLKFRSPRKKHFPQCTLLVLRHKTRLFVFVASTMESAVKVF